MICDICGKSCEYWERAKKVKTKEVPYYRLFCKDCYDKEFGVERT